MAMFLKANFKHIPDYGAIPMIAPKDIRACLPTRFAGRDADLVTAKDVFDALNNPAASPTLLKTWAWTRADEVWVGGLLFLLQLHNCRCISLLVLDNLDGWAQHHCVYYYILIH